MESDVGDWRLETRGWRVENAVFTAFLVCYFSLLAYSSHDSSFLTHRFTTYSNRIRGSKIVYVRSTIRFSKYTSVV